MCSIPLRTVWVLLPSLHPGLSCDSLSTDFASEFLPKFNRVYASSTTCANYRMVSLLQRPVYRQEVWRGSKCKQSHSMLAREIARARNTFGRDNTLAHNDVCRNATDLPGISANAERPLRKWNSTNCRRCWVFLSSVSLKQRTISAAWKATQNRTPEHRMTVSEASSHRWLHRWLQK